jgi:hypothetical protein
MLSDNEIYNTLLDWNNTHSDDKYSGNIKDWDFYNDSGEWDNIARHADDITL